MSIEARYRGVCPECGDTWQPGDTITRPPGADAWQHAECPDARADPDTLDKSKVCPQCFTLRSANGKCMCP